MVRLSLLGFVLTLALAASARADDGDDARALFAKATHEYKLGRFREAVELYRQAYDKKPLPAFLFNLGQCHFALEEYEQAVFFYEGYLRESPETPNRALVEELIREAKALRDQAAAAERARLAHQQLEMQQRLAAEEKARLEAAERAARAEKARLEAEQQLARTAAEQAALAEQAAVAARAPEAPPVDETPPWLWPTVIGTGVAVAAVAVGGSIAALAWPRPPADSLPTLDWRDGASP